MPPDTRWRPAASRSETVIRLRGATTFVAHFLELRIHHILFWFRLRSAAAGRSGGSLRATSARATGTGLGGTAGLIRRISALRDAGGGLPERFGLLRNRILVVGLQ